MEGQRKCTTNSAMQFMMQLSVVDTLLLTSKRVRTNHKAGTREWDINKTLGINSIRIFYQNKILENMTNTKHESMNYSRDGANEREPENNDSRPNKWEEGMDTNSNIWTMFDDRKNTGGWKKKQKQSKQKLNEEQMRNDKRFKPSGELATNKQRIETTPTNTEPTCRTDHAGNVTTQHSKRKRIENEVDNIQKSDISSQCN